MRSFDMLADLDTGFAGFTLFAQHVRQLWIIWLYGCAAIFDGDFLLVDQHSRDKRNVNLFPAIRDCLIAALYIGHRGRQILSELHLQIFFYFDGSLAIRLHASHHASIKAAIQDGQDISIRICIFIDQVQFTVDMNDKILQGLIDF